MTKDTKDAHISDSASGGKGESMATEIRDAVWVCGACGKYSDQRDHVGDESCYINASLCDRGSLQFSDDGRVKWAVAVPDQREKR